jgi:hypothetical protein
MSILSSILSTIYFVRKKKMGLLLHMVHNPYYHEMFYEWIPVLVEKMGL